MTIATFVLMLTGLVCQIIFTNTLALKGNEFAELRTQKLVLEKTISNLQYDDSKLTAISSVKERAQKLGFVQNTSPLVAVNVNSSTSVAVLTQF